MLKKVYRFVLVVLVLTFTSASILAQTQEEITETANRTAVIEKGVLKSVSIPMPDGGGEKAFTFEWAADGSSFTMISDIGERTQIFYNNRNEIQSVKLPNNEVVQVIWQVINGQNTPMLDSFIGSRPGCDAARQAALDAILAAGITCAVERGPGCWSAVAFAGVMTARAAWMCRGQ